MERMFLEGGIRYPPPNNLHELAKNGIERHATEMRNTVILQPGESQAGTSDLSPMEWSGSSERLSDRNPLAVTPFAYLTESFFVGQVPSRAPAAAAISDREPLTASTRPRTFLAEGEGVILIQTGLHSCDQATKGRPEFECRKARRPDRDRR